MAITANSKPRFKERHSRSFRALQRSNSEDGGKRELATDTTMNGEDENDRQFSSLNINGSSMQVPLSTETKKVQIPATTSNASMGKPLSLRDQIRTLEPINEIPANKVEKIMDSVSGPFTESDVQELLLSYTYTSGMIDNSKKASTPKSNTSSLTSFKKTLRKKWADNVLFAMDKLDKLQAKLFEYFWMLILYLNFWFPKWASFLRYV